MRAPKLVQHMKGNADGMSKAVLEKIRASQRCTNLLGRVSPEEQKRYAVEIYSALTDWLATERDASLEQQYVSLGMRRAQQGVPFSEMFWAVCIAREYLWEYMQQECLLEEPVEFWGGVNLLRSLNQFFDFALYFTLIGYQKATKNDVVGVAPVLAER
jgi:hypothetical protein